MKDINDVKLSPGSRVLAVAPHPDDIALSCGGLVRQLSEVELTLLTCFSRSTYAPFANIPLPSADAGRAIRTGEDREYAHRLGAMYIDLGLDDVSVRLEDPERWICEHPPADDSYVGSIEKIASAVSSEYTHILCPLAVGHHIDHIITREAVCRAASKNQLVLYYEDLPYGARVGGPVFVAEHASLVIPGRESVTIDITSVIETKVTDIGVYSSQVYPEDVAGVLRYGAELGRPCGIGERFWVGVPAPS